MEGTKNSQTSFTFEIAPDEKEALVAEIEKLAKGNPYIMHQRQKTDGKLVVTIFAASFTPAQAKIMQHMADKVNVEGLPAAQKDPEIVSFFDEE